MASAISDDRLECKKNTSLRWCINLQPHSASLKLGELSSEEFLKLVEEASPDELLELSKQATPTKPTRTDKDRMLVAQVLAVPEGPRTLGSILLWWELRRVVYTVLLMAALVPSGAYFVWRYGLGEEVAYGFLAAFMYLCMANVCYTSGSISELIARKYFGEKAAHFGSILFALGTGFSILLTLFLSLAITWLVCS